MQTRKEVKRKARNKVRKKHVRFENYMDMFKLNSGATRQQMWWPILKHKLIPYKCAECGITTEYNGKLMILQIDHIDGNPENHHLDNLQLLCPNCHSQTDTYCIRNGFESRTREWDPKDLKEAFDNCKSIGGVARFLEQKHDIKSVNKKYLMIEQMRYKLNFGKKYG
tara:strand:+ start:486 stop:986 length:501 start_codon:yes stop_codon:yes gene_type:complete